MKLKQPDTWECKLSQEGNKAATWEKLIGVNQGPRCTGFIMYLILEHLLILKYMFVFLCDFRWEVSSFYGNAEEPEEYDFYGYQ